MVISIELYVALIFLSGLGFIFGITGTSCAIYALIKTIAVEKSTHTVHLQPVDTEIDRANEEYLKQWGTSEESINEQNQLLKEDLETEMPQFYEEEKEIISF